MIARDWLAAERVTLRRLRGARRWLGPDVVRAGLLVVESRVALEPPPAGAAELQGLDPEDVVELGEVLAGSHPGRTSADQITVYKSMGHAAEDAAAARLVHERARADGLGTEVEL